MSTITLVPRRIWFARVGHAVAVLALGVLVVGVPIALSFGGSPFPAHAPHIGAAWRDLRAGYVPTVALQHVALVAGWCAWAFLSFEILAETRCVLRTHTSRRSPALGPLQPLLAKLVAAAVLSMPLATIRPIVRPAAASAIVLTAQRTAAPVAARTTEPAAHPEQDALATYTVRRGDTLWGIAERYLGDPLRWKVIAALNADRHEGRGEFTDPHWIYPGWTLVLPADATGLPTGEPAEAGPSSISRPVASTSHGAASARHLAPVKEPATSSREEPVPMAHPAPPEGPLVPRSAGSGDHTTPRNERLASRPARVPVAPIGGALLAAGLLGLLVKLRRVQMRHRRPGRRIALPTGALAQVERSLAIAADTAAADVVDRAVRLLGVALHGASEVPEVLGAVVNDEAVDFLLAAPLVAPPPFASAAADRWRLEHHDPSVELALLAAGGSLSVLPSLVTVGEDGDGVVLLNLEAGGTVAIGGDSGVAREVATAVALELASASWVECLELVDIGVGTGEANPHYCSTVEHLADALAQIERQETLLEGALSASGHESSGVARLREPTDRWSPLAVVCTMPLTDEERAAIGDLDAPERHGLAVVVAEALEHAHWQLVAHDDGTLELPMLGRRVRAQRVSRGHLAGIAALLGLAASRADVAADAPPYDNIGPLVTPPATPPPATVDDVSAGTGDDDGAETAIVSTEPAGSVSEEADAAFDPTQFDPTQFDPAELDSAQSDPAELDFPDSADAVAEDKALGGAPEPVDSEELEPGALDTEAEIAGAELDEAWRADAEPDETVEPQVVEVPVLFEERALVDGSDVEEPPIDVPMGQVEVGVLGSLAIAGLAAEPERGKATELIVWLALHPNGASNDTMMTALWPKGISARTAWNTRWDARRALGTNETTGQDLLEEKNLVLSPEVSTDWARFRALAASGRLDAKRRALSLVRGRPFERIEWLWVTMEGFAATAMAEVADLAVAVGEEGLAHGAFNEAIAAAEKGLLAAPYDERLFRIVMRANDGLGNPGGVRATMQQLESLVEDDVEPFESVHPETRALYDALRSKRSPWDEGDGDDPGAVIRRIH